MKHATKPAPLVTLIIISLLGCCMEIDISIPSFPSIMEFFHVSELQVQNTMSLNFVAFCLSGLLYGPLSEAWGRRGLMLFGATAFLIGAVGCVFSFSIYQLMFWRFIQGLGASSTLVLGFTMISDYYHGDEAAKHISRINAFTTIFMAAAPIIGSSLIYFFTWRANFTVVAVIAAVAFVCLWLWLPETKTETQSLQLKKIGKDYWRIITNRKFMLYALVPNMLVTAYLVFVGNAAFYYINTCKLPVLAFALHQGSIVCLFSLFSFYTGSIIARIGSENAVRLGMIIYFIGVSLLTIVAFVFPFQPLLITAAMWLMAIACVFPMSVTFAKSLEIIPDLKGTCSSFIMSSRLLFSSAGLSLTGWFFDGSMRPVAVVISGVMVIAVVAFLFIQFSEKSVPLVLSENS